MILDQIIESYHSDTLKKKHTHTWNPPFHPMSGNALRMEILLPFTMWDIATNVKALGGSGEKLPMGDLTGNCACFFHWYSQNSWCQELQGMRVYHFRPGSSGLFSWKQQTGVWLTVANVLPNLAVFAREVLILIFVQSAKLKEKVSYLCSKGTNSQWPQFEPNKRYPTCFRDYMSDVANHTHLPKPRKTIQWFFPNKVVLLLWDCQVASLPTDP